MNVSVVSSFRRFSTCGSLVTDMRSLDGLWLFHLFMSGSTCSSSSARSDASLIATPSSSSLHVRTLYYTRSKGCYREFGVRTTLIVRRDARLWSMFAEIQPKEAAPRTAKSVGTSKSSLRLLSASSRRDSRSAGRPSPSAAPSRATKVAVAVPPIVAGQAVERLCGSGRERHYALLGNLAQASNALATEGR